MGCRSSIFIKTFFQIWIWSMQIDFIANFRFERFHTIHNQLFILGSNVGCSCPIHASWITVCCFTRRSWHTRNVIYPKSIEILNHVQNLILDLSKMTRRDPIN